MINTVYALATVVTVVAVRRVTLPLAPLLDVYLGAVPSTQQIRITSRKTIIYEHSLKKQLLFEEILLQCK